MHLEGRRMIRDQWYAVMTSDEVRRGKPLGVVRLGEKLVFWRNDSGELFCLRDACIHRGASLSGGECCGNEVICPFHGFHFDGNGKVTQIPANGKKAKTPERFRAKAYSVREKFGMIFLWWGNSEPNPIDPPFFENLDNTFSGSTSKHPWNVHYSRAVENQLDLVHLPYVHRNSIGRGNRTLVNGPVQVLRDNQIQFWVYNDVDRGQSPLKADQLPAPDVNRQHIHFIFPNIWQNWISPEFRIFVAFAPVDDANTVIYMRTCQKFVTFPGLKHIVNGLNRLFSIKVLKEDESVVCSQIPIASSLKMDEKLIPGDLPIITYRRMREDMKNSARDQADIPA